MPVTFHETPHYAYFRMSGLLDLQEVVDAIEVHYGARNPKLIVWDLSDASLSSLTADGFQSIVAATRKFAAKRGAGAKTAFVVNGEIEKILMNAYSAVASARVEVEYKTFFSLQDAEAWLRET